MKVQTQHCTWPHWHPGTTLDNWKMTLKKKVLMEKYKRISNGIQINCIFTHCLYFLYFVLIIRNRMIQKLRKIETKFPKRKVILYIPDKKSLYFGLFSPKVINYLKNGIFMINDDYSTWSNRTIVEIYPKGETDHSSRQFFTFLLKQDIGSNPLKYLITKTTQTHISTINK